MTRPRPDNGSNRAPQTFEALRDLLAVRFESLSGQSRLIAAYVVDHPDELALETITTTAGRIGVQPSSVVRFAQAIGYAGYTDMQRLFRARLIAEGGDYRERLHALPATGVDGDAHGVLRALAEAGILTLQQLRDQTDPEALNRAVAMMADAREIALLGQRRAFPVAFYMAYALARLGRRHRLIDGAGGMLRHQLAPLGPEDVAILTSFAPYAAEVGDAAQMLRDRGVPVIALSDSALSPIAQHARVAFAIRENGDRVFRGLAAPMCLAQGLILGLGLRLENDNGETTP